MHPRVRPAAFFVDGPAERVSIEREGGVDGLFGVWLSFFREHLATFVAILILLPLSLVLNWQLGLLLVVLIAIGGAFDGLEKIIESRTGRRGPATPWATCRSSTATCGWQRKRGCWPTPCAASWWRNTRS